MILGDAVSKLYGFEPYFKVHNLVSVHPKSVIFSQMTNLNMAFHMVVSIYRLVKILKLAPVPWWISERLILASIFCRTRGLDLCGLTIEPSNYCAVPAEVPWLQVRKLERSLTKFIIYGMIDISRKVNRPIFSEGIYAFDIWGIACYRKLVMRGFSQEYFKSPLDGII